jgi:spermidine synthase
VYSAANLRSEPAPWTIRAVLVLIGLTAVIAQIVLMRELIVVFSGNEISLGLMLASWLFWTALGSSVFGRWGSRLRNPRNLVASLEGLIALALPSTIMAARASKGLFQLLPGEILGPGAMFLISLVVLSLFCVISGWLFAAGSRLLAYEATASMAEATGTVYLLEAIGSGVGGILASLLLIRYFTSLEIALFLGLLNLLAAVMMAVPSAVRRSVIAAALLGVFASLIIPAGSRKLEAISLARLWRGFHLVATRNSVYGNLAVVETEGGRSTFENGGVIFNVPDPAAAEEAVHYALLEHHSPKSVLLIGGGVNGSLREALKHPTLRRLDYVELDPAIIDLARQYFSKEWASMAADPRVRVYNLDGRLFLKTTNWNYDVIIVNLPDPQTAQLNRFYTREFFQEAAQKLKPGGILSFQLTASENYISPELSEFLRSVNKALHAVFSDVITIPGDTVHFFAASQRGVLLSDPQELLARLRSRGIQTSYVREYYVPFRMTPERMADLESQIRPRPDTRINRDFAPVAYYFDVALWSARFSGAYRKLFRAATHVSFGGLAGGILALAALALVAVWRSPPDARRQTSAGLSVAAMGFTLIGLEMLILLAFQAIYGYVYHQLAIVIAGVMVGMALGSWWALRRTRSSVEMRSLAVLQAVAALSPLVLYLLFRSLAPIQNPGGLFLASQIVFPVLALCCGLLGGLQFPLASRIFFGSQHKNNGPGTLYAMDLAGACVAAVLFSVYLIPVFGLFKTAMLTAMVNLAPAVLASLSVSESESGRA